MEALKGRPMAYHLPATTKIVFIDSIPILPYERNVFYVLWISVQFILKESLLGWDCEWFSDLSTIVHLIQISGKNCVWLIDGKWLMELKSNCEAQKLFELIVHNKSIYHVFKGIDDIVLLQK